MLNATPALRLYARWRGARLDALRPAAAQEAQLLRLVRHARDTRFGRDHGFAAIRSVADFQRQVPLRRFEDYWRDYAKEAFPHLENLSWPGRIPYFAETSGTSGGPTKHIPVSKAMLASNNKAGIDLMVWHLRHRPKSQFFGGKNFMLGGSRSLAAKAPGIASGDLTGIALNELPRWVRPYVFPSPTLALPSDWEAKIDRLAPLSRHVDIRILAGTTSWLLLFFDKLRQLDPQGRRELVHHYPNLELVSHGGVNFAPYRKQFEAVLQGGHAELREVYPASEGFIASADRGVGEGLRMNLDNGLFYEFVPLEELDSAKPTRLWLKDVERDQSYAIVLSTCAGLWGHVLGDTVRFVDLDPPRLLITGRTSYSLSAFGEHLSGEEIERAVTRAAEAIGADVVDFTVGAVLPEGSAQGRHRWVVEFAGRPPAPQQVERFADALDRTLAEHNDDYRVHRQGNYGVAPPEVLAAAPGSFKEWMRRRGKLGGQNKVPRVLHDNALLDDLTALTREPRA
jgi:hypothetical protein